MTTDAGALGSLAVVRGGTLIEEWARTMKVRGLSRATLSRRVMTARRFTAWLGRPLEEARPQDIVDWLWALDVSDASRSMYLADLRALYRWAAAMGHVGASPAAAIEPPARPHYFPRPIETAGLAAAIAAAPPRVYKILTLGAFAGLRVSEIARLDHTHIDRDHQALRIRGKGERHRVVPIHPRLGYLLRHRRGPVIVSARGGPLTSTRVTIITSEYLHGRGLDATAHQLRHWFGTETCAATGDIRAVQELMGHASPATTAIYTEVSRKRGRAAVMGIDLPPAA